MSTQIVPGSIQSVAKNGSVALAAVNAEVVLICDRSGSMAAEDAHGGRARYAVEDEAVENLQKKHPGKIVLIAFADLADMFPGGYLPPPNGSTNMIAGLEMAKPLIEAGLRGVLISDGEPNHPQEAVVAFARGIQGKLDTIYVGPEGGQGEKFLKQLAKSIKGSSATYSLKKPPAFLEKGLEQILLLK